MCHCGVTVTGDNYLHLTMLHCGVTVTCDNYLHLTMLHCGVTVTGDNYLHLTMLHCGVTVTCDNYLHLTMLHCGVTVTGDNYLHLTFIHDEHHYKQSWYLSNVTYIRDTQHTFIIPICNGEIKGTIFYGMCVSLESYLTTKLFAMLQIHHIPKWQCAYFLMPFRCM